MTAGFTSETPRPQPVVHRRKFDVSEIELALAAFSVLNHPESPECHFELKQAVMAMGFCPRCEWRPCECGERYDD
jgi:hypothetical protein